MLDFPNESEQILIFQILGISKLEPLKKKFGNILKRERFGARSFLACPYTHFKCQFNFVHTNLMTS
jgi:hypothetical protein